VREENVDECFLFTLDVVGNFEASDENTNEWTRSDRRRDPFDDTATGFVLISSRVVTCKYEFVKLVRLQSRLSHP
jgi:hypothetical protein